MTSITLNQHLRLQPILATNHAAHLALMQRIYPPAFAYLWPDDGAWYLERTHSQEAFLKDLAQADAPYWHVYFRDELIGIFRLKYSEDFPDQPGVPAMKLDRIYLDAAVRGQGIGKALVAFAKVEARRSGKSILWLDRMDTNEATIAFYCRCGFKEGSTFRLPFELMYPEMRGMQRLWLEV
ncbi:MAG: GNAT family N-acetyltransferase [Bacteroidota bacterium]